jgi:hypothetical protein
MFRTFAVVGALWLIASPASGQPAEGTRRGVASSFEQLQVFVGPGDRIKVTDVNGQSATGIVTALTPTSLSMRFDRASVDLGEADVALVRQRRDDPLANGALRGMGFALAVFASAALYCQCPTGFLVLAGTSYAALGAGLGVGIDALVKGEQVIFQPPVARSDRISVTPILGRRVRGASIAFGF